MDTLSPKITLFGKTMNIKEFLTLLYTEAKTSGYDSNTGTFGALLINAMCPRRES